MISDERDLDIWYDGRFVTVAGHKEKVFAQAPMPDTLDRSLDVLAERYALVFPAMDLLYSSAEKALWSEATRGGEAGGETVDGVPCRHLAFTEGELAWEVWIPLEGDPLPRRLKTTGRTLSTDVTLHDWNLAPPVPEAEFVPIVPSGYEGIAMLQHEAVLAALAAGESR